jgi:hypothetical protein
MSLLLPMPLSIFSQFLLARRNMKAARHKHFAHLAGKCFYAWSNYTYLVALGLDRKRWPGPRKYEVMIAQSVFLVLHAGLPKFDVKRTVPRYLILHQLCVHLVAFCKCSLRKIFIPDCFFLSHPRAGEVQPEARGQLLPDPIPARRVPRVESVLHDPVQGQAEVPGEADAVRAGNVLRLGRGVAYAAPAETVHLPGMLYGAVACVRSVLLFHVAVDECLGGAVG